MFCRLIVEHDRRQVHIRRILRILANANIAGTREVQMGK